MDYHIEAIKNGQLVTKEIQAVIDECSGNGGGNIYFKEGEFRAGTLYLKSNVHLKLADGAVIRGSENFDDYTTDTYKQMYRRESHMDKCFIFAKDCENISITGGTFDGMGSSFDDGRPMMFRYLRCNNIRISHVKMKDPAAWTNAFIQCKNIWIDSIDIHSRANKNGDGVDFDACENVYVSNSKFNCSDDCICVQNSTKTEKASNIFISNNLFESKWAGIRIGLLSTSLIENIFVSNCAFKNIDCSGLKIQSAEGAVIRNIHCSNLTMENVRRPFYMTLNYYRENVDYETESIEGHSRLYNITIKDVYATTRDNNDLPNCMIIDAVEGDYVENVTLADIHYTVFGNKNYMDRDIPYLIDTRAEAFKYNGDLPASGLFARNVKNLKYRDLDIQSIMEDSREKILVL